MPPPQQPASAGTAVDAVKSESQRAWQTPSRMTYRPQRRTPLQDTLPKLKVGATAGKVKVAVPCRQNRGSRTPNRLDGGISFPGTVAAVPAHGRSHRKTR